MLTNRLTDKFYIESQQGSSESSSNSKSASSGSNSISSQSTSSSGAMRPEHPVGSPPDHSVGSLKELSYVMAIMTGLRQETVLDDDKNVVSNPHHRDIGDTKHDTNKFFQHLEEFDITICSHSGIEEAWNRSKHFAFEKEPGASARLSLSRTFSIEDEKQLDDESIEYYDPDTKKTVKSTPKEVATYGIKLGQSQKSKKQQEKAIAAFLAFPGTSKQEEENLQAQLHRLNEDVIKATNELLFNNYTLNNRRRLIFELAPFPEYCQQKYTRNDKKFTLEVYAPVFKVTSDDESFSGQFGLDVNDQLEKLDLYHDTQQPSREICRIKILATLDLSEFPWKSAAASLELTITTNCSTLHYDGPQDPNIRRMETSVKPFSSLKRFNISEKNQLKLIKIEQLLRDSSSVIALQVGTISAYAEAEKYNIRLLLDIVCLFKQALMNRLLKRQSSDLRDERKEKKGEEENTSSIDNLTNLVTHFLQKHSTFKVLFTEAKVELSYIFCQRIFLERIPHFLRVLFGKHIEQIRESAIYISQNSNDDIFREVGKINDMVLVVIDTMRTALNEASMELNIKATGFPESKKITEKEALQKPYLEFLQDAKNEILPDNPFTELLKLNTIGSSLRMILSTSSTSKKQKRLKLNTTSRENSPANSPLRPSNTSPNSTTTASNLAVAEDPPARILYFEEPKKTGKWQCCPGKDTEKKAALWNRNPVFQSLINLAPRYAVTQFLRLFPGTLPIAEPYLVIMDVVGGAAGLYTGMQSITSPNKRPSHIIRIYKATSKASVVLVGTMAMSVNTYLLMNPNANDVSTDTFLREIAPAPIVASTIYLVWESFPDETKTRWFSRNFISRLAHTTFNVLSRTLLYSGVFEFLLLNIFNVPGNWESLLIPIAPALLFSLLYHTRVHEKVQFLMTALTAADFAYMLIRDAINQQAPVALTYSREVAWSLLAAYSTYFTAKNAIGFVEEYQNRPILISQRLTNESELETGPTVTDETQKLLAPEAWDTLTTQQKEKTLTPLRDSRNNRNNSRNYGSTTLNDSSEKLLPKKSSRWGVFGGCNIL